MPTCFSSRTLVRNSSIGARLAAPPASILLGNISFLCVTQVRTASTTRPILMIEDLISMPRSNQTYQISLHTMKQATISKCNYRNLFSMLVHWATLKQHPGLSARKTYTVYLFEELFFDLILNYQKMCSTRPSDLKDIALLFKQMIAVNSGLPLL